MHRVSFWSISERLNFFNSCVWVHQLSSVWKDGSQNHTVTAGKGSNIQKMLENWRICRTWRIFLKNRAQFNCSEQTRDSWTTNTKQKTVVTQKQMLPTIDHMAFQISCYWGHRFMGILRDFYLRSNERWWDLSYSSGQTEFIPSILHSTL